MTDEPDEWLAHMLLPWQRVTLLDGSRVRGGYIMRRKVDGAWQYRVMTSDESAEEFRLSAW